MPPPTELAPWGYAQHPSSTPVPYHPLSALSLPSTRRAIQVPRPEAPSTTGKPYRNRLELIHDARVYAQFVAEETQRIHPEQTDPLKTWRRWQIRLLIAKEVWTVWGMDLKSYHFERLLK